MRKYSIKQCALMLYELTNDQVGKNLDQALQVFIKFLIAHNKISQFERIIEAYQLLDDQRNSRVRAQVVVAHELSTSDEKAVKEYVASVTNKAVVIEQTLDTRLVGGFKITIGDVVYDGSVQSAVMNLQKQLSL